MRQGGAWGVRQKQKPELYAAREARPLRKQGLLAEGNNAKCRPAKGCRRDTAIIRTGFAPPRTPAREHACKSVSCAGPHARAVPGQCVYLSLDATIRSQTCGGRCGSQPASQPLQSEQPV